MLKMVLFLLVLSGFAAAAVYAQSKPGAQGDVRATILALERAALDRSDKGDVEGFLEISEPEVTYFDPSLERPIRGLEALRTFYHSFPAGAVSSGEMSNADVQVCGDIAVLTFNYAPKPQFRGPQWNATEVYRHGARGWRIIHTHWSYRKPQLAQSK